MKKVRIFSTPACPYCKRAKQFLTENKIEFEDVDVSANTTAAQEMITLSGQMAVPVLEIEGKIIVGFNQPEIEKALGLS